MVAPKNAITRRFIAAALLTCAGAACRGAVPTALPERWSVFESPAWGIRLEFPATWEAKAGEDWAPLVVDIRAPGHEATIGAGMSVVAAFSAAPLDEVAASFAKNITGPVPAVAETTVAGYPARALAYAVKEKGRTVINRTLVVGAPERYFLFTFAAYQPQFETTLPYFEHIEKSITIK